MNRHAYKAVVALCITAVIITWMIIAPGAWS